MTGVGYGPRAYRWWRNLGTGSEVNRWAWFNIGAQFTDTRDEVQHGPVNQCCDVGYCCNGKPVAAMRNGAEVRAVCADHVALAATLYTGLGSVVR